MALLRGKMGENQFKYQRENRENRADCHIPLTSNLETEILKGRVIPPLFQAFVISRMLKYSYHEMKSRHEHRNPTGY